MGLSRDPLPGDVTPLILTGGVAIPDKVVNYSLVPAAKLEITGLRRPKGHLQIADS